MVRAHDDRLEAGRNRDDTESACKGRSGLHRAILYHAVSMAGSRRYLHEKACALAVLVIAIACPELARADEPATRPIADAIDLGPSTCLEKKALAEQVGMWLGTDVLDKRVSILVADAAKGVRFVVKRSGEVLGERTLSVLHVPCQEIHAAVGLGIASAIDATILTNLGVSSAPGAIPVRAIEPDYPATAEPSSSSAPTMDVAGAPASSSSTSPWAPAPTSTAPPLSPAVWIPPPGLSPGFGRLPPVMPKKPYPAFTLAVSGMALVGLLPKVTWGIAPSAEVSVVRGFDLEGAFWVTGTTTSPVGPGTADAGFIGGELDACAVLGLLDDVIRLRGCGGILAGGVNASGSGFDTPQTGVGPWLAPMARVDGKWSPIKRFGFVLGIEGFVPIVRPTLQAEPDTRPTDDVALPAGGVGFSLGPEVTF